jgi:hypothetical protein
MKRLLELALVCLALATAAPSYSQAAPVNTMPIPRTLTSTDGRKMDVIITEKTATGIKAKRATDQKEFELELARLSAEDQTFVAGLVMKKYTVFMTAHDKDLKDRLEKAGFKVTMPPTAKENGNRANGGSMEFFEKITDDELKKFDLIWASSWGEMFMLKRGDQQADRLHQLAATGRPTVWKMKWKMSKKSFIEKENPSEGGRATSKEYTQSDGNVILYNWQINQWDQKTGSTPVVAEHPEILDQTIAEARKILEPQP